MLLTIYIKYAFFQYLMLVSNSTRFFSFVGTQIEYPINNRKCVIIRIRQLYPRDTTKVMK